MSDSFKSSSSGLGLGTVLTLIFVILKLTDHIDWSWWWVLSPIWIGILIVIFISIFCIVMAVIQSGPVDKFLQRFK